MIGTRSGSGVYRGHGDGVLGRRGGWLVPGLDWGCIGAMVMVFGVGEVVGWYPVWIRGV